VTLHNCGHINPERIDDYIAGGGYQSTRKALLKLTPDQVIDEIKRSGLRGRGGAGFPTGIKWELCRRAQGFPKYVICNADEGNPGAFMDGSILEADPHAVFEGLIIAAYAVGAAEGYIYVRAEYPLAVSRLRIALQQSQECGYLGNSILGSGFNFTIHLREGAGAFVCGEETALVASIEGQRGMPHPRPPISCPIGTLRKTDQYQQCEDTGHGSIDHRARSRLVLKHRHGKEQGHGGLLDHRESGQHRPR